MGNEVVNVKYSLGDTYGCVAHIEWGLLMICILFNEVKIFVTLFHFKFLKVALVDHKLR